MLALNANRVTALDVLVDALWGANPPSTARTQTQICISTLRKLLQDSGCAAKVITRSPGYLLEIDDDDLDLYRFDKLVVLALAYEREGKLSDAVGSLRTALALWRGPALADVPSDRVSRAAVRLDESRVTAEVHRLRVELALGRHVEIIGDVRALLDDNPGREELYECLMMALYRSGRQFEALEVFRQARTVLIETAGVEPGDRLRRLQLAILNRDKELVAPLEPVVATPRRFEPAVVNNGATDSLLPSAMTGFVGRERAVSQILELLGEQPKKAGRGGLPRVVGIWGEGGVGKSVLAVDTAHLLEEHYPDGCLFADLQAPHGDEATVARVLERFLRALGVPTSAIPDSTSERVASFRSQLRDKRLLLVLDSARSTEQLLQLMPAAPGCAALVTSRVRLPAVSGARWFELAELGPTQSLELLAKRIGAERIASDLPAAEDLVRFCAGSPFRLRLAGARLAGKPQMRIAEFARRLAAGNGDGTRTSLAASYEALSGDAQRLFRLLGLVEANEFPRWTAAALLDEQPDRADDVFEDLVDSGLVDVIEYSEHRLVRYRVLDFVRAYARELLVAAETEPEREAATLRLLGAWLARAEQAHRQEFGGDYAILHGAAPRWAPKADEVSGPGPERGIAWLEDERAGLVSAVRHAARAGLDELCWDLALTLITLFEAKGYYDDWGDTARVALDAAKRAENRRGQAAMLYGLGSLNIARKRLADASADLTRALELFDVDRDVHGRGLVLRNLAFIDWVRGDLSAMRARYEQALLNLRAVGDRMGEAYVLCNIAKFSGTEGNENYARELFEQALEISVEVSCRRGEAVALCGLAELYLRIERPDDASELLNRALRIVQETGDQIDEAYALYTLGLTRKKQSRPEHAEIILAQALDRARRVGERQVEAQALYQLGELLLARGEVKGALGYCAEANRILGGLGQDIWRPRSGDRIVSV